MSATSHPLDLSLCLVGHDCETKLADTLGLTRPFVREVLYVDLNSQDRTQIIAAEYGARVFTAIGRDNHAAVLNAALAKATSRWILYLQPGEWLNDEQWAMLAETLDDSSGDFMAIESVLPIDVSDVKLALEQQAIRVFRNDHRIVFNRRCHPSVQQSLSTFNASIKKLPIRFPSTAIAVEATPALELLHLSRQEDPADVECLFYLGVNHARLGNWFHAECYLSEFANVNGCSPATKIAGLKLLSESYFRIDDPLRADDTRQKLAEYEKRISV